MLMVIARSLLLAFLGTLVLRLGGRKSISEMTTPQVAVLISIGTILGSDVGGSGIANSIVAAGTFIAYLVLTEWVTLKWRPAEKSLKGDPVTVISDGKLLYSNLKLLRMTVHDLHKRLRMIGISRIEDIQTGTIENNGEFGYELMPHAKPVTMKDLEYFMKSRLTQEEPARSSADEKPPFPKHLH